MKAHLANLTRGWTGSVGPRGHVAQRLAAACAICIAASPVKAMAPEEASPTASATIGISVSVAQRYGLSIDGSASPAQGSSEPMPQPFCLASNGGVMHLPVMLAWASSIQRNESRPSPARQAVPLARCEARDRNFPNALDEAAGIREVIVTPE